MTIVFDILWRSAYWVAYRVIFLYWFVVRPHMKGVQIILVDTGRICLVQHTYMHRGRWEFPGGAIRKGETAIEAAQREAYEELGVNLSEVRFLGEMSAFHDYHTSDVAVILAEPLGSLSPSKGELAAVEWFETENFPLELSTLASAVLSLYRGQVRSAGSTYQT